MPLIHHHLIHLHMGELQFSVPVYVRLGVCIYVFLIVQLGSLISWTINTKYYVADVSLWMAHLHEEFSIQTLPMYERLAALVMVFDMNDVSLNFYLISIQI